MLMVLPVIGNEPFLAGLLRNVKSAAEAMPILTVALPVSALKLIATVTERV